MKTTSALWFFAFFAIARSTFTHAAELTGYLIDKQCLGLCESTPSNETCAPDGINVFYEPNRHTKWCLLLSNCIKSGYMLLSAEPNADTGRHEPIMDFSSSSVANATVLNFIETGSAGTAPLVSVVFEDGSLEIVDGVAVAGDDIVVQDPWDDEVEIRYSGMDTHQVECVDSDAPDITTNNFCFRSDVVVTETASSIVIESNGCPDHMIMQGSKGLIANSQPDPLPSRASQGTTETKACGACGASGCGACGASGCGACGASGCGACGASGCGACGASGCGACGASACGACGASACGASACGACGASGCGAYNASACGASVCGACGASACGASACGASACGASACGACGASACGASTPQNIDIAWDVRTYDRMSAKVGDSVTFTFMPLHNVAIHKNATCDFTDSVLLATEMESPFTYVFKPEDVGEMHFACQLSSHCEFGQLLTFDVTTTSTQLASAASCGAACGAGCGACDAGCGACGGGCGGCGVGCGACGAAKETSSDHSDGTITPHFQHYVMEIPLNPGEPSAPVYFIGDDVIGLLSNGVVLDSHKATWAYDSCGGHSDNKHQYHYHIPAYCFLESVGLPTPDSADWWINDEGTEVRIYADMSAQFPANAKSSPVIGFARDGHPIFGPYDENGNLVVANNGKLDECNGMIDSRGNYGYYLTPNPPFAPPCLRGNVGTFSYRTTNLVCPSEGVTNLFIEEQDILANCESIQFGSAPDCASTKAAGSSSTTPGMSANLLNLFLIIAATLSVFN